MKGFNAIKKGFSRSKDLKKYRSLVDDAISKGKKADAEAAAKKIKEAQEKAARAKREKELIKSGEKKGAKRARRKMVAGAAAAGTIYYEGKTGNVSKAIGKLTDKAKEAYRTRNPTKQTHTKAPVKAKAGMKEALQGPRGGVKEIVKKANSTSKKPTTTSKKSVKK